MSSYVDWSALGQVVLASVLVGAGLPALFALGLRGVFQAEGRIEERGSAGGDGSDVALAPPRRVLGTVTAVVCFVVVLAAVVGGIVLIVRS
ncbi:hypothetical protein GCM10025864_14560 [Luteimicrobium album]|uniref:Uncharacterized protein n=1 Tax=Luteimicrobium album TaxID=1054550 RepID=A0ABQ6HZ65_9MICO|nr:hypothetical protein [Luteimicrobium album]GMA23697.1 hypothetical protein GCM10025864_14560 [Luteimicrobium album]